MSPLPDLPPLLDENGMPLPGFEEMQGMADEEEEEEEEEEDLTPKFEIASHKLLRKYPSKH